MQLSGTRAACVPTSNASLTWSKRRLKSWPELSRTVMGANLLNSSGGGSFSRRVTSTRLLQWGVLCKCVAPRDVCRWSVRSDRPSPLRHSASHTKIDSRAKRHCTACAWSRARPLPLPRRHRAMRPALRLLLIRHISKPLEDLACQSLHHRCRHLRQRSSCLGRLPPSSPPSPRLAVPSRVATCFSFRSARPPRRKHPAPSPRTPSTVLRLRCWPRMSCALRISQSLLHIGCAERSEGPDIPR